MQATEAVSQPEAEASPYADHGARLAAFLLDQLLLCSILFTLVAFASLVIFVTSDYGETDPPDRSYFIAIGIIAAAVPIWVLYHAVLWGTTGQTLGKMVMGLRVVDRHGERIGMGRALLRTLAFAVSALALHLPALLALFGYERRTVHDVIAGTVVARTSELWFPGEEHA